MDGVQWGIAMQEDAKSAWITLPYIQSVQEVDTVTMKTKEQLIKVTQQCYGIALIDDDISVGGSGKIYIISKAGELQKTLDIGGSELHSISVGLNKTTLLCSG